MRALVAALAAFALAGCSAMASKEATVACQAADVATTIVALKRGAVEGNPVMAKVVELAGIPGLVLVKLALVLWLLETFSDADREEYAASFAAVNALTCAAAAHNVGVILKQ